MSLVKQLSDTRWSARYEAVEALLKGYNHLCEVLQSLACDVLGELDIVILIIFWEKVLERFHQTSLSPQTSTLNLNVMVSLLESLVDFINNQRTEF